jgi:hypothetical protein
LDRFALARQIADITAAGQAVHPGAVLALALAALASADVAPDEERAALAAWRTADDYARLSWGLDLAGLVLRRERSLADVGKAGAG